MRELISVISGGGDECEEIEKRERGLLCCETLDRDRDSLGTELNKVTAII